MLHLLDDYFLLVYSTHYIFIKVCVFFVVIQNYNAPNKVLRVNPL